MKITYREYSLTPDVIAVERFNLSRTITTKATKNLANGTKKGHKYDKEEILGYGYRLTDGIKQIVAYELIKSEDVVDLKDYIRAYKEQLSKVESILG